MTDEKIPVKTVEGAGVPAVPDFMVAAAVFAVVTHPVDVGGTRDVRFACDAPAVRAEFAKRCLQHPNRSEKIDREILHEMFLLQPGERHEGNGTGTVAIP